MRRNAFLHFRNKSVHCRERRKSQRGERGELSAACSVKLWPWGRSRVHTTLLEAWTEAGAAPGPAGPGSPFPGTPRPRACPLFSVTDPQPFYKQVILVTKDAARAGRKVRERPQRRGKHITPGRPFLGRPVWPRRASRGPTGRFGSAVRLAGPGGGGPAHRPRPRGGREEEATRSVGLMEFDLSESDSLCCLAALVNLRHTYLFISKLFF